MLWFPNLFPEMHTFHLSATFLFLIPFASAQLNLLARASGKLYFGTATDNPELPDGPYLKQLRNTQDFAQLTPVCKYWLDVLKLPCTDRHTRVIA